MRGILKEFREFAMRGSVIDLAVGVVVGTAFGKIVSSLVADIVTPLLALITGGSEFKNLSLTLRAATADMPAVTLGYGTLIQAMLDFVVIALALFLFLKLINTLRKQFEREKAQAKPAEKPYQERLLEEIRDLLKEGK